MGSPRVDVVFRLWQCDKENHGWREGPPRPVPTKVVKPEIPIIEPTGKEAVRKKYSIYMLY